jgi:fatty acid desaturase
VYLGSVFAPNHKGMLIVDDDTPIDFLRLQVLTARNVKAHPLTDFWYGGLNYQIEHHLFPSLPMHRLRDVSVLVKKFCAERHISYHETSMIQSYREILGYLDEIGASLRRPLPKTDPNTAMEL